jgi:hypothetical protein
MQVAARSRRLKKPRFANLPFMVLTAGRAARPDVVAADAEQGVQFAIDADVDVLTRVRADKMQPFHGGLRIQDDFVGSGLRGCIALARGRNLI